MTITREQYIASSGTALVALLIAIILLLCKVTAPEPTTQTAQEEQEVFFTDIEYTFKEVQVNPSKQVDGKPASAAEAQISGTAMNDNGSEATPPTIVTAKSKTEAPAVAAPAPEKPQEAQAPTQEEINAQKAAAIRNRMGRSTGMTKNETGAGNATQGNALEGNNTQSDGLGLAGRRRLNTITPAITNVRGMLKVQIRVDAAGNVTAAAITSSSGFGEQEAEVRNAVIAASRKLKYSPAEQASQSGIITWNIK